ncbi:MAG: hypothetical protein IJM96_08580 [Clostridia bacterium]|nr:hypothetical protein [Clostridia bacterium]MBQ6934156.1 hypothetical protein [Clostridia bacterium]MBQ7087512.1 hypothetical protein [Clostridia bacterium]
MDQAEVVKQEVKQEEKKPRNYALADWKYEKIREEVEAFQAELSDDDDVDVCLALTAFGSGTVMQVTNIGYQNPDILYFYGYVNGNKAQIIQHMSQLNFMLMTARRADPAQPPRRIGFSMGEKKGEIEE